MKVRSERHELPTKETRTLLKKVWTADGKEHESPLRKTRDANEGDTDVAEKSMDSRWKGT
ncbi:hypothetical protein [Bacteroides pyogenes]|uniref:Uncharacterized protein n=2 Tax=Bacteroides pyogenes TaxID=310300 RepID=A0A5D3FN80_9BACE|nr:hypothetical protein [Bacteroides pyogenes]TYK34300.1 hypothetical protein FNJ60_04725 [Bacteroides pyogenes]TYK37311.1 hypothetical protein FNJ59_10465 [Bacteroides pyogenes]TYK50247.1 hypothetical protein FNG97_04235 [Bacteroides pyogenes]